MPISTNPDSPPVVPHEIACMEVWGGSRSFDGRVSVPGQDVHVSCIPYLESEHGGDIYYISNCAGGIITRFVLADVSGHGEQVAQIARDLRALMRRHINAADQSRFAMALNTAFADLGLGGKFATALLLTYFAPTDHLIVCNAGHPRPLWYRAALDQWQLLDSATPGVLTTPQRRGGAVGIANLPLGILDPTDYEQFALPLGIDDVVVLYTDALIEAPDVNGNQLGEEGLLAVIRDLSNEERSDVAAALRTRINARSGSRPLDDDATLIVLRHNAGDPPPLNLQGHVHRFAGMLGLRGTDSGPGFE